MHSEPNLFFSASTNVNMANNLINECINDLREIGPPGEPDGADLTYNSSINVLVDSGINLLMDKIETTKDSLFELDKEFAHEYYKLVANKLEGINPETLTGEELIQYTIHARDFDYALLYMLERHESEGNLTEDMKKQLEIQRIKIDRYEIVDDMSKLSPTSKEYIDKYDELSEIDKKMIETVYTGDEQKEMLDAYEKQHKSTKYTLDFNMKMEELKDLEPGTDEYRKKENEIRQLTVDYYNGKENLTEYEKKDLKFQEDYILLNNYYIDGDKAAARTLKVSMIDPSTGQCIATADEIKYENSNWWGRTWMNIGTGLEYAGTFVLSAVEGFIDIGEGVVDAHLYGISKTLQVFGVDDKWAEDIISYDVSSEGYNWVVEQTGIDPEIAYGPAHTVGNVAGEMLGYYALSAVPFVGVALCAIGGAGAAAEDSMNSQLDSTGQINDWEVFGYSALGALEGFGAGKAASAARSGFKAAKQIGTKAVVKQAPKILGKTALQTLKDPSLYIETGLVLADDVYTGVKTGQWDVLRMLSECGSVYLENWAGNVLTSGSDYLEKKSIARQKYIENQRKSPYYTSDDKLKIPLDEALNDDGSIYYPPEDGFCLDKNGNAIKSESVISEGSLMDRYDHEYGRFVGLEDKNGKLATYEERSLAYTQESNTEYHKYKITEDISTESLTRKYNSLPLEEQEVIKEGIISFGLDLDDYLDDSGNLVLHVYTGKIAPAYGLKGGGQQASLPVSINTLKNWGFIKEIN